MPEPFVESFEEGKRSAKERLDALKKQIQETRELPVTPAAAPAAAPGVVPPPPTPETPAQQQARFNELKPRVDALKESATGTIDVLKSRYSDANAIAKLDELQTAISNKITTLVAKTTIGELVTELNALKTEVTNVAAANKLGKKFENAKDAIQAATQAPASKIVSDEMTPQEIALREQADAGMGFLKGTKWLFDLWMSAQPIIKMFQKMKCMGDKACVQQVETEAKGLQDQFDAIHGTRDLRERFSKALKGRGLTVRQGTNDELALVRFKELEAKNPTMSREAIVSAAASQYLSKVPPAAGKNVVTLYGILFAQEAATSGTESLQREAPYEIKFGNGPKDKYQVNAKGDALIIGGAAHKLKATGTGVVGKDLKFSQLDITKKPAVAPATVDTYSLTLGISSHGLLGDKVVHSETFDGNDAVKKFLDDVKGKKLSYDVQETKYFGMAKGDAYKIEVA
ncbi:MAG: hypothetical protein PHH13_00690 [Candidatus Peribacteraceae bacterium]|nr:hypothetical protein [Candidatus Peribacteraceae bacterium]